jgi:hypothetical protein
MIGAADSARSRSAPGAPSATTRQPDWTDVLRLVRRLKAPGCWLCAAVIVASDPSVSAAVAKVTAILPIKTSLPIVGSSSSNQSFNNQMPSGQKKLGRPEAALLQVKYVVAVCSARDALAAPPARAPRAAGKQARSAGDVLDRRRVARLRAQGRRARRLGLGAGGQGKRANNNGCSRKRDRKLEHRDFLR